MQVIPSACAACEEKGYEVSDMCKGCVAHPCREVCPVGAISMKRDIPTLIRKNVLSVENANLSVHMMRFPKKERPCAKACGVNAIDSDKIGRAHIDNDKCVSCGMCMVSCPFGAISDKSQIFQLGRALKEGGEIIAEIAPAFVGQFGPNITPRNIKAALQELGFAEVYEVALGADIGAIAEAHHYVEKVVTGELPFFTDLLLPGMVNACSKNIFRILQIRYHRN